MASIAESPHRAPSGLVGGVLRPAARRVVWGVRGRMLDWRRRWTKTRFEWQHATVKRARRALARELTADSAMVAELTRAGFLPYSQYVNEKDLDELRREIGEWSEATSKSKDFFQLLSRGGTQHCSDAAVRIARQPALVALASAYFGELPYLLSVELIKSTRTESAPRWKQSQLWHKDLNDSKVLKLFIYLNDVDENNGPFAFVPAEVSGQQRLPYYPVHKSDELIAKYLGAHHERTITGAAGTAFLIDTAMLLHRGSRIEQDRHRLVYLATFTTFSQFVPRDNRITCDASVPAVDRYLLHKTGEPVIQ